MDMSKVEFRWASEDITGQAAKYWPQMLDIARRFTLARIMKCCTIMGRAEGNLTAAQVMWRSERWTGAAREATAAPRRFSRRWRFFPGAGALDEARVHPRDTAPPRLSDAIMGLQVLYPIMQCTDIFFLRADICQLGVDQRKVRPVAPP